MTRLSLAICFYPSLCFSYLFQRVFWHWVLNLGTRVYNWTTSPACKIILIWIQIYYLNSHSTFSLKQRTTYHFPSRKCHYEPLCVCLGLYASWIFFMCLDFSAHLFTLEYLRSRRAKMLKRLSTPPNESKWLPFHGIKLLYTYQSSNPRMLPWSIMYVPPISWVLWDSSHMLYNLSIPWMKQQSWHFEDSANIWRKKRSWKQIYRNRTRISSEILQMTKEGSKWRM